MDQVGKCAKKRRVEKDSNTAVLNQGCFCPQGDISQYLETVLVVTVGEGTHFATAV